MIPRSFFGRLAEPSPQQNERDLARLINRTAELAAAARRELGYAAVNLGCDGVTRVTMFDGSACQTSGDVCLATREEGITVCLDTPRGNGLNFQRVAFSAPDCSPVTGWWIVDAEGYLYRVTSGLVAAAPYWPMGADPGIPASVITLVRSGTWARLMCGASLSIPLNTYGTTGLEGVFGEGDPSAPWWDTLVGGRRTLVTALPTVTARPSYYSPSSVKAIGTIGVLDGTATPVDVFQYDHFTGKDSTGTNLMATEEYRALITTAGVRKGVRAPIGEAAPVLPVLGEIALANVTVRLIAPGEYLPGVTVWPEEAWDEEPVDLSGELVTWVEATVATAIGMRSQRLHVGGTDSQYNPGRLRAILHRDSIEPNAGSRAVDLVLPSAGSGIVSGTVRVAYGYPYGSYLGETPFCYRRCLAVEYGEGHVNLAGDPITDAGDFVPASELTDSARDVGAGVVALPGGEIALLGAGSIIDTRVGERYRVRPAPASPVTVTVEHQTKGAWGDDPNAWTTETHYPVAAWASGPADITVQWDHMSAAGAPGRPVPCVLWETPTGGTTNFTTAPVAHYCNLGPTTAGVTQLLDGDFDPFTIPASIYANRFLTILGPNLQTSYGWTAEVRETPSDEFSAVVETAMSPLTDFANADYEVPGIGGTATVLSPRVPIFSLKLDVPGGPAGTVRRHVYRFAFDWGGWASPAAAPWYDGAAGLNADRGGLYDRMCRRVATIESVELDLSDGSETATICDEDTSLSNAGTRPPSPLVYLGPIAVDAPRPVHPLQPMNL